MPTEILLVRHGETDWNRDRRWQGHADPPLNEEGRRQAQALAEALAGEDVAAVYSSDLLRAHETARIVAERLGLEVTALPDLREVDVGSWSGLTRDEIAHRFPGAERWEGGETREEMAERVLGAVRRIAAAHPGGRVLVVTHGGPVRALLRHCAHPQREEAVANCSLVRLEVD